MKLTFRQGIARHQSDVNGNPTFLQRSGNYVDLVVSPEPTVILFAHKTATYVVEELKSIPHAWGPFTGPGTKYLYWDVDLLTGVLTRGFTLYPVFYTSSAPANPSPDQHWFDTVENQMRVWNGRKWQDKIRVFAGFVTSNTLITPERIGSQAGLTSPTEGGNILLDSYGMPLRQSDGTFCTTATWLNVLNLGTVTARLDQPIMSGMAAEEIPQFSCVSVRPGRRLILSRSTDHNTRIAGVVAEDLFEGDTAIVISTGVLRAPIWNFPAQTMNRPVFCGPTGQVTLEPPTQGVLQQVGFVYDVDAIFVQLNRVTVLDDPQDMIAPPPVPPSTAPIANFTFGPSPTIQGSTAITGTAPFEVHFADTSMSAAQIEWDFVNDGFIDSVSPTPSYTYSTPGTYTVRLRASNSYGYDDEIKTNVVNVVAPNTGPLQVNLGLSFGAPAQVMSGNPFSIQITTTNDGLAVATNVQRVIKLRTDNGTAVSVLASPPGSVIVQTGVITQVTLPATSIVVGGSTTAVLQLSVTASANAVQLEGTATSPETDPTPGDNSATLTIPVKP